MRFLILFLLATLTLPALLTIKTSSACTSVQADGNKVAAQYGLKLYDCDKDEVSRASKDAVYDVIWRGYVAQKGSLSKEYIKTRWARVEDAFWRVWGESPLWQAKVAAAICSKEFLCGVQIKFSEWESKYWIGSQRNNNGTIDCGITQINSDSTEFSCDELQDFTTAFREQKRIIMLKVRGSSKRSVWRKRIHRYNHARNHEYGHEIWGLVIGGGSPED